MHVLICDDEQDMQLLLQLSTESLGHTANAVGSAAEAIAVCREQTPDVLVLDISMPDTDGPTLIRQLRESQIEPREMMLVSAITPDELARIAEELDVKWLPKPCTYTEFADALLAMAS